MYRFSVFFIFCSSFVHIPWVNAHKEQQSALDTENVKATAISCVQKFGTQLVQFLSDHASFSDIHDLIQKTFDMKKMAQRCCPVKYKTLSQDQKSLYEERFIESVCRAYYNILKKYYTPKGNLEDHFKVDAHKSRCYPGREGMSCTVVTDVFASNGARISVKWLVRNSSEDEGKIANFSVEGTDMVAATKRDMKSLFKQKCGSNFKEFLEKIVESDHTAS
ncbi:hopanoid biosynthesis associated membrane protein HpnM [Holospora obtusa F1]|uniref:Hopanoid biosynthesis associated membrane protein HpnM n=1 Tax=Holospora obtusa F1 TaxID=1399147 RepID=W6TD78_HOLOB|nr:ABC transporter substrate-binding protein [Holospora obtusa]ETZ06898.1 hopanoid biosynthesis associated membrane protein HpnM [Holospora obtusa F1]